MGAPIIHRISRLNDKQVVHLVNEIEKEFGSTHKSFSIINIKIPLEEVEALTDHSDGQAITHGEIHTKEKKFEVLFRRGTSGFNQNNAVSHEIRVPSPYYDEIIVVLGKRGQPNQSAPSAKECFQLERLINKYNISSVSQGVVSGATDAIEILQDEIAQLATFHRKMLEDADRQRQKLESDYNDKHLRLQEQTAADRKKVEEFASAEKEKIALLSEELETAQKELDDRDHMHVRRELRAKISEDIENRVSEALLPKSARITNVIIILFTVGCAIVSAFFAYQSYEEFAALLTYEITENTPAIENIGWLIVAMAVRGSLASIVSIGFLIYALSWMRRNYLENIQTSNDLQRYALDINRASWTIETIMEIKAKDEVDLPNKWIEGVCYGLFRNAGGEKTDMTPLDAWGALLNVSGKAEYGPDGPRMEFNRGQAKKLAKGSE